MTTTTWSTVFAWVLSPILTVSAIDQSIPAIGGDESRKLLDNGTDVVVAILDSGVDGDHPSLVGDDSLGRPRLAGAASFVASEPQEATGDIAGHGTGMASIILGRDPQYTGLAPDARYLSVRVLDQSNKFPDETWVRRGVAYALNNGADVLNISLNRYAGKCDGNSQLELMLDWASEKRGIVIVLSAGNIATGDGARTVRYPGGAWNAITVGTVSKDLQRVDRYSGEAFTADNRMKPDLVAPGIGLMLANHQWRGSRADFQIAHGGSSCAAAHVSGLAAQLVSSSLAKKMHADPLVYKAVLLNSAKKVRNKLNRLWEPAYRKNLKGLDPIVGPLDIDAGAGLVDCKAAAELYLSGQQKPGVVSYLGWDLHRIGSGESIEYKLDDLPEGGGLLTTTLVWPRHVQREDLGETGLDESDRFRPSKAASNLRLEILQDGKVVAKSFSKHGNVEHLSTKLEPGADCSLRVVGASVEARSQEEFCIAWKLR